MSQNRIAEELLGALQAIQTQGNPSAMIVQETLDNVQAMLAREDRGWKVLQGNELPGSDGGLTLKQLQEWSKNLRESTVGAPRMKRGFSLRHSFIWKGGIKYNGVSKEARGARNPRTQEKIDLPVNQRNFFGKSARRRRELCLYTDGIALWVGDDATKELHPVPVDQITDYMTDPDYPGVIWAYRRAWKHRKPDGVVEDRVRWYFVDDYKSEQTDKVSYKGPNAGSPEEEIVETGWTAFDMHANSFEGWALGVPDALAAWIWDKIATDLFLDGVDVSSAMASLAFKVNTNSKSGAGKAGIEMASPMGAAGTAVMGAGMDLSVLSSARTGYDFSGTREVVALIASSLDVSNIHLTANPGDAGSSYGSASSLDEPGKLTMMTRRDEHAELDERVLAWMGAKSPSAYFEPFDDGADVYRRLQSITLPWLQGVITDEVYKEMAAAALGVPSLGATPDGFMYPNNINSASRSDVDSDGSPTGSTAAPTQGRSSGAGDGANARDTRDDAIG